MTSHLPNNHIWMWSNVEPAQRIKITWEENLVNLIDAVSEEIVMSWRRAQTNNIVEFLKHFVNLHEKQKI